MSASTSLLFWALIPSVSPPTSLLPVPILFSPPVYFLLFLYTQSLTFLPPAFSLNFPVVLVQWSKTVQNGFAQHSIQRLGRVVCWEWIFVKLQSLFNQNRGGGIKWKCIFFWVCVFRFSFCYAFLCIVSNFFGHWEYFLGFLHFFCFSSFLTVFFNVFPPIFAFSEIWLFPQHYFHPSFSHS